MSLAELNQKLKEQNLIGYWTIPNTSTGFREPEPSFRPFLWKWQEIRAALDQAAQLIRPEDAGEPAILFSINGRPAIEALGFFREETQ